MATIVSKPAPTNSTSWSTTKTATQSASKYGPILGRGEGGGSASSLKPLSFEIECTGLKPNTKHDFYYQNEKSTSYCRSLMEDDNVGSSTLQSDSSGKLKFKFQLPVKMKTSGSVTQIFEPAGDKLFEVRAVNSSARKLVPFKDF